MIQNQKRFMLVQLKVFNVLGPARWMTPFCGAERHLLQHGGLHAKTWIGISEKSGEPQNHSLVETVEVHRALLSGWLPGSRLRSNGSVEHVQGMFWLAQKWWKPQRKSMQILSQLRYNADPDAKPQVSHQMGTTCHQGSWFGILIAEFWLQVIQVIVDFRLKMTSLDFKMPYDRFTYDLPITVKVEAVDWTWNTTKLGWTCEGLVLVDIDRAEIGARAPKHTELKHTELPVVPWFWPEVQWGRNDLGFQDSLIQVEGSGVKVRLASSKKNPGCSS